MRKNTCFERIAKLVSIFCWVLISDVFMQYLNTLTCYIYNCTSRLTDDLSIQRVIFVWFIFLEKRTNKDSQKKRTKIKNIV